MTEAAILWGHALAALMFAGVALRWRHDAGGSRPQAAFVAALLVTALWALATAGIDPRDFATRAVEGARDVAWLVFMLALVRRSGAGGLALGAMYGAALALTVVVTVLSMVETLPLAAAASADILRVRLLLQVMAAIGSLMLTSHLRGIAGSAASRWIGPAVIALTAMWGFDLLVSATAYATGSWPAPLVALRGFGMAAAALVLGLVGRRGGDWGLSLSRTAALRSLTAASLLGYVALTLLLTGLADATGGVHARLLQTAAVLGSTTVLLTLASTPWLRAWAKVKVAKHLFRHRYDYRVEWLRFAETLGTPADGPVLAERVVKAVADLIDAPAGLLLVEADGRLEPGQGWNWSGAAATIDVPLGRHLVATGRILDIDVLRSTPSVDEARLIPAWLLAEGDARALVPLLHGPSLIGAIVLACPPVSRALDWEDFDLLRVVGRQAASYLAEDRAHAALADAARFDEFNRRFAFILHDIKNIVSGLTLVARNAERHADNPAFRVDMVATLRHSADRMNVLLARLAQHHQVVAEPPRPVDLATLARELAAARRAQHAIEVEGGATFVMAPPGRLEQVLGHLVQNAMEASHAHEPVIVRIAAHGPERAAVDVIDRGCGMTPDFVRDRLFRPFVSSKPDGFGLGAHEARELARAMGGELLVTSRLGEGTLFRLILPVPPHIEIAA